MLGCDSFTSGSDGCSASITFCFVDRARLTDIPSKKRSELRPGEDRRSSRSNVPGPRVTSRCFERPVPAAKGMENGDDADRSTVSGREAEPMLEASEATGGDEQWEVQEIEEHRRLPERDDQASR